MPKSVFHNTGKYIRFILRRERVYIITWIVLLFVITICQAQSFGDLYPTQADRQIVAESMSNPAMTAIMGKTYGKENYTLGALMSQQTLLFTVVATAIMNILFVNRNLRGDEEAGRIELVRSRAIGKLFNISAAIIVSIGMNVVLSVLIGAGLGSLNMESMDLKGSMLFGTALGASGFMFAAITAFINQLFTNAKGALGFSFGILGFSYFVRAIGDIGNENIAMISPLGWVMRTQVYVKNIIWPIMLLIGVAIILLVLAIWINNKRNLGAGIFHERSGRDSASAFLRTPLELVVKILRMEYFVWIIVYIVLGLSFGAMMNEIKIQMESNEMLLQILACDPKDGDLLYQFINIITSIFAMITTIPVITTIVKVRNEEVSNRIECLISKAITRRKLLSAFFFCAIFISVVLQLVFAVSFWCSANQVIEGAAVDMEDMLKTACVYIPAIWIMAGLGTAIIGLIPNKTIIVWIFFAYSFFVNYFGAMLDLDEWMIKISPYGNVPNVMADGMEWKKLIVLLVISIFLTVLGYIGYRRRDLQV